MPIRPDLRAWPRIEDLPPLPVRKRGKPKRTIEAQMKNGAKSVRGSIGGKAIAHAALPAAAAVLMTASHAYEAERLRISDRVLQRAARQVAHVARQARKRAQAHGVFPDCNWPGWRWNAVRSIRLLTSRDFEENVEASRF